ncbi:MAG: histidine--tRNA ligase, partial [Deltaproteobacteria bacterium]|nr:histidine--tRNA ligase [Deltaproteobacteria bacterium]
QIEGAPVEKLAQLKATPVQNELFQQGIVELETVLDAIRVLGLPERNYDVDLTIARGLDYYTGTVYETRLDDYPDLGSICSGGRYDNLAGYYTREKLPGVGASIGLTRLFHQLMEAQLIKTGSATKSLVLIIPMTEDNRTSLELASILRSEGIPSQVYSEKGALGKKLKYADRLGVPFSVIIGEDEVKGGYFTLKAMAEKRESKVGLEDLKTHLRKGLSFA